MRATLTRRHGDEDFTVTSQEAMLDVFGNVMDVVTLAVGAIGGISLFVGAIGVLTMMWIAVGERTAEIGLVRAFGASRRQVRTLFLVEAGALGLAGGAAGLAARPRPLRGPARRGPRPAGRRPRLEYAVGRARRLARHRARLGRAARGPRRGARSDRGAARGMTPAGTRGAGRLAQRRVRG